LSLAVPLVASADFGVGDSGLNDTANGAYGEQYVNDRGNIGDFVGRFVIQPVLGLLGLLFLCLMVYAGGLWMTASGNEKRVQKAKDILVAAVIGAVIIIAAYTVTTAVFSALTTGQITGPTAP
jgi:hypothetical protein